MSSVEQFYDDLSQNYHLQFSNWEESIKYHSMVLDKLICKHLKKNREDIDLLDCSCGIGTQAIGLALMGYKVSATDLSEKSVERCKEEAQKHKTNIKCSIADFRTLEVQVHESFQCIISCDNALPHLITGNDLSIGMKNIYNKLHEGGIFLASMRDYDLALESRKKVQSPYVYEESDGRRIALQVWDWNDDNTYKLNLYLTNHHGSECTTNYSATIYKAWKRTEMTEIMNECGFKSVRWYMPEETEYHQPIVIGYK